ncbi:MAG TPA: FkbM family methyltransferase [Candidatus Ozemobacteraceae bacterium]|nr:FkbM family methyltransferase [Candidatus Ozemobacteraceae bacterium]
MTAKPRAIYGASLFGRVLFEELQKLGEEIDFFIDEYTPQATYLGKPVRRLKEVDDKDQITVMNSTAYPLEQQLREKGFGQVLSLREIVNTYPQTLKNLNETMWALKSHRLVDEAEFAWLAQRLQDNDSKALLETITKFRQNPVPENLYFSDGDPFYFPSGFDSFRGIDRLRFVDCGAFTGDTVQSVFNRFPRAIDWIAALEPDPHNLEKLRNQRFNRPNPHHANADVFVFPVGVFDREQLCHFQMTSEGSSSAITSDATGFSIPVARLDVLFAHAAPNYIKMDVEGV